MKNPFRYRSYYYDNETKLYYLNSRYYDPELGRFINIDDINVLNQSKDLVNGLNLYAYCSNNPVMFTDTNGKDWWSDFWNGIKDFFTNAWDVVVGTIVSIGMIAGGVALTAFTGGALYNIGSALVGAGVGSLIGGIQSKNEGNSYWSGYLGGIVSGGLTGLGVSFGPIGAFLGGLTGNFLGTVVTDYINGIMIDGDYILKLAAESALAGIVAIGSWKFGTATDLLRIPGFRDIYAGFTVLAEFAASALFNEAKKVVNHIAQIFRRVLQI